VLRLLLLRHAKAVREAASDVARPLAPEGVVDAEEMGTLMAAAGYVPAAVLCSPSVRTRQTLECLLPGFGAARPTEAAIDHPTGLYNAGERTCLDLIRAQPGAVSPLLLVGHNPSMHDLAGRLVATGPAEMRQSLLAKFPTTALAVIEFDAARWADIGPGQGTLTAFMVPGG